MKQNVRSVIFVVLSGIVALVFIALGFLAYIYKDQIVQAFQKKPENFTELYFENYTSLPTKIVLPTTVPYVKQTTADYSFAFTIHNLENKDMNYTYEVYEIGADKTVLDKKTVEIKNGEHKTITENYSMPLTYPNTQVLVSLPDKNQHIAFWMWGKSK